MREWWSKLRIVLRRHRLDEDLKTEVESHLQMEVEANIDRGMNSQEALEAARRGFGNRAVIQESSREAWLFLWLETALQDARYGMRLLRRSPGFAFTAVAVIALGIGATTAGFTLLDHVLLRPLPFPHPEQLVRLFETDLPNGLPRVETSPPNFLDWRAMNKSLSSMGAYAQFSYNLSGRGDPLRLDGAIFTSDVFTVLDVQPIAGRAFGPEDDRDGAPNVVMLSERLAASQFGTAESAVGRILTLDNQAHSVVGVMPSGFAFPSPEASLWKPVRFSPPLLSLRRNHVFNVIARLRPDVSVEQARSEMDLIAAQLERAYPKDNAGLRVAVVEMRDVMAPQSRVLVVAVFGAALCLLLIACTNLANLLLARALVRRQEIAVRVAVGAGHWRLIRQLFTESLVLAVVGGTFGSLLAVTATPWLARLVPNALPVSTMPEVDLRIFAFAALLTLVTSVAFGVGPALRSSGRVDPMALRARSASGGRTDRLRSTLVVVEVVGTVALLVGAGLLLKALWRVQAIDPGFRPDGVLTLRTWLPTPKYNDAVARREFYSHVLTEARALPRVMSAAYTTALPLVFGAGIFPVTVPGIEDDPNSAPRVSIRFVTPDFFTALGIPLRRGRFLSDRDDRTAPFVTVISESLATRLWPGQDPIGRTLKVAGFDRTVVGVLGNIAVRGLERVSEPQTYFPVEQIGPGLAFYAPRDLAVRASGDPMALLPSLRKIIHDADPQLPVSDVRLLEDVVAAQTATRRDQLFVLGTFATIALLLAAIGIHGLLSFIVSARTREIGVRVALGAARSTILGMFLRQGLVLGIAGVAVAVPLAYLAARGMKALLFSVEPGDPLIYGSAGVLAMVMTLLGALRPALMAATIDPAMATRTE
jgi:predicted permease